MRYLTGPARCINGKDCRSGHFAAEDGANDFGDRRNLMLTVRYTPEC